MLKNTHNNNNNKLDVLRTMTIVWRFAAVVSIVVGGVATTVVLSMISIRIYLYELVLDLNPAMQRKTETKGRQTAEKKQHTHRHGWP